MASPYIIPAPKNLRRGQRRGRRRGWAGAVASSGPSLNTGSTQTVADEETTKKSSSIPLGAAVVVLLGVLVLSKGR